jgi:aspartyl-tRNA(Asn)/glutamyl-tRNA(Gln) amidotransferase subunit A
MKGIGEGTASELRQRIKAGDVSAQAVTQSYLDAIRQCDPRLGTFLHVDDAGALAQARRLDVKRRQGKPLGALAGLPVAVKDVLCTKGVRTTCGSRMLEDFVPPYDAHVISRLKEADAILIGKTNMDEFAMGSSTEHSAFQITRNPWDTDRTPGGSSGGSATAVAAGLTPLALGSDTGGSIRQPASFCGVVGIKPTYGRVSRYGLIAFASSLDQVGPLARNVTDTALLLESIAGHDARDSTSVKQQVPAYCESLETPIESLRIGLVREFFAEGLAAEVEKQVREAIRVYQSLGARIQEVSLPHSTYSVAVYYLVATSEASSNLARYDGVHFGYRADDFNDLADMVARSRGQGFGKEVRLRIMLGTFALSSGYQDAYYLKALKVRRLIKEDFDRAFAECDVLVGPTSPTTAFRLGERLQNPLAMYLADVYTISANLAGIPAINVPCGFTSGGLPVGLQIMAPAFEEEKLLRTARMFERATDWHMRRPDLAKL